MILAYSDYTPERRRFDAEIVVVGTGAGGAVVGAELAQAGFDVLFVEEGGYHAPETFNAYLKESVPKLYRDGGATAILGRAPIPYVEGRCVGGSTTINGGMAYRPPTRILEHWEELTASSALGPAALEAAFLRVEEAVHVAPQRPESIGGDNRVQALGAAKMGWRYQETHRSQDTCVGTNTCMLGCPTGAKQSTLVSYMPRALEAGAGCLTEVKVDKLIIERGRAVGVRGRAIDPHTRRRTHRIEVRARAVIVACGAVQTPVLLQRHGLGRPSRQLGKNFLCHPNVKMAGVFPFEVQGWKGVSQGGQVREFHDQGIVLAENFVPPGIIAAPLPMIGSESWQLMQSYNHMVTGGVLVEDSTTGTVRRGPFGMALPRYDVTEYDKQRFVFGAKKMAEMWFALGAELVISPFMGRHHMLRSMDEVMAIDAADVRFEDLELFAVHLMGTARMGSRPERSVVDLAGQLWDLPGCYVADASVFPTAIAVNPQITIMALATRVAEQLIDARREVLRAA